MSRVVRLEDVLAAVDAVRSEIAMREQARHEIFSPGAQSYAVALDVIDTLFQVFAEALGPERDHDEG